MSDLSSIFFGNKGESKIEILESDKQYCTSLFKNGLWERRKTDIGYFTHCLHKIDIPYLSTECANDFFLTLPKVPASAYYSILKFFRDVYASIKSEVIVQIFWNKSKEMYELFVPEQLVSGARISFDRKSGPMVDQNLVWFADVHSHNVMQAFFSGVDTTDEKSTRIFGVIGTINTTPTSSWRAGCNQSFVGLGLDDVFDAASPHVVLIPQDSLSKVKEAIIPAPAKPLFVSPPNHNFRSRLIELGRIVVPFDEHWTPEDSPVPASYLYDPSTENPDYWLKADYMDAAISFTVSLQNWLDGVNSGDDMLALQASLVSDFIGLIYECSCFDIEFAKQITDNIFSLLGNEESFNLIEYIKSENGL